MNKTLRIIFITLGGILVLFSLALLTGWADSWLSQSIAEAAKRQISPNWPEYFRVLGSILLGLGLLLVFGEQVAGGFRRFAAWAKAQDAASNQWLEKTFHGSINLNEKLPIDWPIRFGRLDFAVILIFAFLAFVYQLAVLNPGFPYVILGGDAANIASFAAGRAYPEMFQGDAILGDLNNLGLYVTVHLPIAIWLEKLVGNFGLAYALFLFPHVFLQYFSYYLLGRVLYRNRYWAFLFSLAVSAPIILDGGEMWGVVSDGMPRFTYQVLIPFILILLLTAWREKPARWPIVMVIAGLMAFIHPVSTPAWAFALWLGFWPILPATWNAKRRLLEMFKLGFVLVLAMLPYVSIYLTYHQGGSGKTNYDLVYFILTEYMPYNLLNIPAAVQTLLHNTAQYGLLWYGLGGLLLTALLFRSERPRLKQMLTWVVGIVFVTILVPFVETNIERTFRIIPLQTEIMRGMRYLVPFLFIFWFYPLAELTRRAAQKRLTGAVFAVGTILTLSWLILNPPYPFYEIPSAVNCWSKSQLICPTETEFIDALTFVREKTPEGSKFVVFLSNRWSGIEVRYLGLRPMVYAYKDRGQLVFTNLEALEQWHYYLQRENGIFSRQISPTIEEKRERILDFARDANAEYIFTDFDYSLDAIGGLSNLVAYQNGTYTILKTYP